jgi:hypothetical protein
MTTTLSARLRLAADYLDANQVETARDVTRSTLLELRDTFGKHWLRPKSNEVKRDSKRTQPPSPTVEALLLALSNGPRTVGELTPIDPSATWGNPRQKAAVRALVAPALIEAEGRKLVVSFRRGGPSGHVLWKLTDLGREVLAGREREI